MVQWRSMLRLDDVPVRVPTVTTTSSGEEAVLVLPTLGQIKVLNEVGARVWELLDGARRVADVVTVICAEYEVDGDRAAADTLVFLAELQAKGLLLLKAGG